MDHSAWGIVKLVIVVVLAILMIVLIAQNTAPVGTRLLFFTATMPLAALLLITLLGGVVIGAGIASRLLAAAREDRAGEGAEGPKARPREASVHYNDRPRISP